jgi:autotransporter-associated beta strand protein
MHPFLQTVAQNSARPINKTRQLRDEVPSFALNNRVARSRAKCFVRENTLAAATCVDPTGMPSKHPDAKFKNPRDLHSFCITVSKPHRKIRTLATRTHSIGFVCFIRLHPRSMRIGLAELRSLLARPRRSDPNCPQSAPFELALLEPKPILMVVVETMQGSSEQQMDSSSFIESRRTTLGLLTIAAVAVLIVPQAARAQQTRVTGLDVSYYQGVLSQANWNTIHNTDGRSFTFIRSTRGGTTGTYDPNNTANDSLARRYDDPYFVQNITEATNAGMFAGPYHFGRPDVIATTANANGIANTGANEADHMLQMAGAWMRPGYLLPIFDFEAGDSQRTPSDLAQFAIDFSNRVYQMKGIRPGVYIGNNYASPMDSIPESAALIAAMPTLWTARWPNQSNPSAVDIQGTDPGDYTPTVYGPWDNPANSADPWHFWQYASTAKLQGISNATANVDVDVAHGGIDYVKDHLVPALWLNNSSGDWNTLASWNSGEAPVAPISAPGQQLPTSTALPATRLPGVNDTVILDRPNANITITLSSGTQNIRKLYAREALDITGGTLNIGYAPSWDSTPISAEFASAVSLGGTGSLSVNSVQVDSTRTFTLSGGSLTFSKINLMPDGASPAKIAINGTVVFNPISNATATIANGTGNGLTGFIDLSGGYRSFDVANGSAEVDLAINVPIKNGGLTKLGAGTMALNGANTYTGNTTVQAGRLRFNSATLADAADVYVASDAILDLNFAGTPDYVHGLFFNGVLQPYGIWGAIGSGAQYTSSLITGTGRLNVTPLPPAPPPPGQIIDDFETDEGHFNWPYNYSPASETFGVAAATTIDRTTTAHQGATGSSSQVLDLVSSGPGAWQVRHNSGTGAGLASQPAGNTPLQGIGYVGFWLKTDDPGITVRIAIDDPTSAHPSALERGFAQNIVSDNEWHLYQWNLGDPNHWDALSGGANGQIDAENGKVTIDSIWFNGLGDAQIYLDNVSYNPGGLLAAAAIMGDYDGDGAVTAADYDAWRSSLGKSVTPGTKSDGNRDGIVDVADYVIWRKLMSFINGGGASIGGTAVPEPTYFMLAFALVCFALVLCDRTAVLASGRFAYRTRTRKPAPPAQRNGLGIKPSHVPLSIGMMSDQKDSALHGYCKLLDCCLGRPSHRGIGNCLRYARRRRLSH